jgi:hypothetical protein
MNNTIIIVLGIILLVLIILNHITIITTTTNEQANCAQTTFGCCPDGVNSKINFYGTNCPSYRPGPGYFPNRPVPRPLPPGPRPLPPKPVGGCAGTRYGCCPNNQTPKIDEKGSNCN